MCADSFNLYPLYCYHYDLFIFNNEKGETIADPALFWFIYYRFFLILFSKKVYVSAICLFKQASPQLK